jgi:hypothetical protein
LLRRRVFAQKADQRELMTVIQRNFRKYMQLRNWGWFVIIQKTRPLVGQPNPEQELRLLEEKCNETYGVYESALNVTKSLEAEIGNVKGEITALGKQLSEEQGEIGQYTERQAKASAMKAELEALLAEGQIALANEEASRKEMTEQKRSLEGGISIKKKEEADVHLALQKVEQEKNNRDHSIKGLNEEIASQDEVINKLNKRKSIFQKTVQSIWMIFILLKIRSTTLLLLRRSLKQLSMSLKVH